MLPSIFGENLFDDFFGGSFDQDFFGGRDPLYGKHARNLMKTDIKENDSQYILDIDLPGFKKDEVQIDLNNGYLTVSAAKGLDKDEQDKDGRYIRRERYSGQVARSFYVGDLKPEDISAKYEDGILKLSLPKEVQRQMPSSNRIAIE